MDRNGYKKSIEVEARERSLPQCLNICPDHNLSLLTDISLDDCGSRLVFKCRRCQKLSKYVEINEIAFSEDSHIFDHYPILPEDLTQKIRDILEQTGSKQNMVDYIRSYFKNLKIRIIQSISDMEEEMAVTAQEIDSFQKRLMNEYNKQSRKIELRDIIFDDQNITQKSEQIKTIVQDVVKKSDEIKQKLMEMIDRFNLTNDNIKLQNLDEISDFIIQSCIKQIKTKEMQGILQMDFQKRIKMFIFNRMKIDQIHEIEIQKEQNTNEIKKLLRNTKEINKVKLKSGKLETISNKNTKRKEKNKYQIQIGEVLDKIEEILKIKTVINIELDLKENSIGDEGAQHLSNAIAKLKNLTSFKLDLQQKNALTLFISLARLNPLENVSSDSVTQQLTNLTKFLCFLILFRFSNKKNKKCNSYSSNNSIGKEGALHLSNAIEQLKNLTSLNLNLEQQNALSLLNTSLTRLNSH